MFTGIVETQGRVVARVPDGTSVRFDIESPYGEELQIGQSIAVDGICLTVTRFDANRFSVTAVNETLERTALGRREVGAGVNLERSLRLGERLDGHLVLGHVDDVATVTDITPSTPGKVVAFSMAKSLARFVAYKGSLTLNGVSLTVARLFDNGDFNVALVPHTLEVTNLDELEVGDPVNVEIDVVARYVERLVSEERVLVERT